MDFNDDIRRLAVAHQRVTDALKEPDPGMLRSMFTPFTPTPGRAAAAILCEELGWLVENSVFWTQLSGGIGQLQANEAQVPKVLNNIQQLLEDEEDAFERLKISPATTSEVLSQTYGALGILRELPVPSQAGVGNLRDRVRRATELICSAKDGRMQRAFARVVSRKGLGIVGGLTVAGANVALAIYEPGSSKIAWTSVKAGAAIASGHAAGIIQIFTNETPEGRA
jgi:hypothetical protein